MIKYSVPWKTSVLNIFNLALFISCTLEVILVVFADVFEEYYIFAIVMDPFQTSCLAPCILNTPCKLRIKIYGNDRMSSKL